MISKDKQVTSLVLSRATMEKIHLLKKYGYYPAELMRQAIEKMVNEKLALAKQSEKEVSNDRQ